MNASPSHDILNVRLGEAKTSHFEFDCHLKHPSSFQIRLLPSGAKKSGRDAV